MTNTALVFTESGNSPPKTKVVQSQPELVTPLLVDLRTAAVMLSTSLCAVRKLVRARKIHHVRYGKKWLISPTELQKFVARELSRSAA